jgi:hypothetical protein
MTTHPTQPIARGDYVRFRNLPADCQPTPLLVTLVLPNGMIRLLDKSGYYAAYLFVVVDPPENQEKSA